MDKIEAKKIVKAMRDVIRHRNSEDNIPPERTGIDLFIKNEFEMAASAFELAVNLQPQNFFSHYYLGRCYRRLGKYPEAIRSFTKAIERNSLHAPSHAYLGDTFLIENDLIESEKCLRRALAIQFDNFVALRGLAKLVKSGHGNPLEVAGFLRNAYVKGRPNSMILMELFSIVPVEPQFCLQVADGLAASNSHVRAEFFYRVSSLVSSRKPRSYLKMATEQRQ